MALGTRSTDELQRELAQVVERARQLDTRGFESAGATIIHEQLVPQVREVLQEGLGALCSVLESYRDETIGTEEGECDEGDGARAIDALMDRASAVERIADLCVIARLDLRCKQDRLTALADSRKVWDLISVCASIRRKLLKSAAAVEQTLGELEGRPSRAAGVFHTELQRSLEIRRVYTRFRHPIVARGVPRPEEVQIRLREAGVAIAKLVGRDVYEDMRVDDRIQLRRLQADIIEWLRGEDGFHPRTGLRLWQDLSAFTELLVLVNNRGELREHDRLLAVRLSAELRELPAESRPPEDLIGALSALHGRDDELDGLLQNEQPSVGALRPIVERLREALDGDPNPEPTDGSGADGFL